VSASEIVLAYYCPCCRRTMRTTVDPRRAPDDVEASLRKAASDHAVACVETLVRALRTAELRARSFLLCSGEARRAFDRNPPILANGRPSTLGEWRRNVLANFGEGNPAARYLSDQIALLGEDTPVFANEDEGIRLLTMMGRASTAAGPWRTDDPPKDGRPFLAEIDDGTLAVLRWEDDGEGRFRLALAREILSVWREIKRWAEVEL